MRLNLGTALEDGSKVMKEAHTSTARESADIVEESEDRKPTLANDEWKMESEEEEEEEEEDEEELDDEEEWELEDEDEE